MKEFDVIVIGGGLLGTATAAALAECGVRVGLFEAQGRYHALGSSHGHSRITRRLNFEAPEFNVLAAASLKAMRKMESSPGTIVRPMPALFLMDRDSKAYDSFRDQLLRMDRGAKELSRSGVASRYGIRIGPGQAGLVDRGAAVLDPQAVLRHLYREVRRGGGGVAFSCPVERWRSSGGAVTVVTGGGERYRAKQLVIAAGGWTPEAGRRGEIEGRKLRRLDGTMRLQRVPLFYFDYPDGIPDVIPMTVLRDGDIDLFAMPEKRRGGGRYLKLGFHHNQQETRRPADVERKVGLEERRAATAAAELLFGRAMKLRKTAVCLYAWAKDGELPLAGLLPGADNVYLAAYGGGVCAKHAIALGTALSCVMRGLRSPYDIEVFAPARLVACGPEDENL